MNKSKKYPSKKIDPFQQAQVDEIAFKAKRDASLLAREEIEEIITSKKVREGLGKVLSHQETKQIINQVNQKMDVINSIDGQGEEFMQKWIIKKQDLGLENMTLNEKQSIINQRTSSVI